MRRSGWNPQRRNRNIGTAKSGFGQDNRMTIPDSWSDRRDYWEKLNNPVVVDCTIGDCNLTILVEPVQANFIHACTLEDIRKILHLIPPHDLAPIKLIVLRQPKRKEQIMCPVWGRLQYWSEIKGHAGPAIYLEAQSLNKTIRWPKSLCVEDSRELERLIADGHNVVSDRRYHTIHNNLESTRFTQLYRTLPHEIGHYVDYFESVKNPSNGDSDEESRLEAIYDSKPSFDKEAFAHQYATQFFEQHNKTGLLPFERILNEKGIAAEGLELSWFSPMMDAD
jgi:hypothetical protein